MRKLILLLSAFCLSSVLFAAPLWMRYNTISPDGSTIAFTYKGDIYTIPTKGGEAKQLTATPYYEKEIVWSPNSKTIAYSANRKGTFSVYTLPVEGGVPTRLTFNSASELPVAFTPDGQNIYFTAYIQKPALNVQFPARWMTELYSVPVLGGRPTQIMDVPVMHLSFDKDGQSFYYENRTGSENEFRKHHVSSVARNIWYYDAKAKTQTQITTNVGEDRSPLLTQDGKLIYLAERDLKSFNIYEASPSETTSAKALTRRSGSPIRFISRSNQGTLCYNFKGEIYTQTEGRENKVNLTITPKEIDDEVVEMNARNGSEYAMTPKGDQIIFGERGEIFATTDEYSTTKQITHTEASEEGITIAPDGRTICYASERTGTWALYTAHIDNDNEINFANASKITEEPLFKDEKVERFAPQYSPDGKKIAFVAERRKLMVYDIESKKTKELTDGSLWYMNMTGGFSFSWSPNNQWIALTIITHDRDPYSDIAVVSVKDASIHSITESAYIDGNPKWAFDGNALLYESNRLGLRSQASWGSQNDVFIAFMNQETMDKFMLSKEEFEVRKAEKELKAKNEKEAKAKAEKDTKKDVKDKKDDKKDLKKDAKPGDKKDKKDKKDNDEDTIVMDFNKVQDRIMRLTPMSSQLADYTLSKDGETLYFGSAFNDNYDLWKYSIRDRSSSILTPGIGASALVLDESGRNLFVFGRRSQKISLASGRGKTLSARASFQFDLAKEREYMFNHMFTQEKKLFFDKSYHGVDFDKLQKEYVRYLPHINNNYDFSEMCSEILGELNVSHTGSGYFARPTGNYDYTGSFGSLFDLNYKGDGLKISEILEYSPFDNKDTKVKAGDIILSINGQKIEAGKDYYSLLNHKSNEKVYIEVKNPTTDETWTENVTLISAGAQNSLLSRRWVKRMEHLTDSLSHGRLGYVYIKSMDDASYRDIYSDILGKYNQKDGIVIDTRFNGGGRLHEDIEVLFTGTLYLKQSIQGRIACTMPSRRYTKPSVMLVAEANYSNAHGTPWVYQHMGIGKIIGMPVPGTMTSVYWETMQDPTMYFGIPIIGYQTEDGSFLENKQLEPDYKVRNQAEKLDQGEDQQLEKAIQVLFEEIKADKTQW